MVCHFKVLFKKSLKELEKMNAIRILRERGYTTIAIRRTALPFIEVLEWEVVDPDLNQNRYWSGLVRREGYVGCIFG